MIYSSPGSEEHDGFGRSSRRLLRFTRGVVIGCLDGTRMWVSSDDEIMIMFSKSTAGYMTNWRGYLPPGLRRFTAPWALATDQIPTFQSDMFQLGLVIWMLAKHFCSVSGVFCRKSGYQGFPRYRCTADHANPAELPPCGSEVPAFVNVLMGHCRKVQPKRRKPAYALLALLPADHDSAAFSPNRVSLHIPCFQSVLCDRCSAFATDIHYHCSVCNQRDFDLCPQSFRTAFRAMTTATS